MAKIPGVETLKNVGRTLDKINPMRFRVGLSAEPYIDQQASFPLDLKLKVNVSIRETRKALAASK